MKPVLAFLFVLAVFPTCGPAADKQPAPARLEDELQKVPLPQLAAEARRHGSATRGAIIFHQPVLACTKCHSVGEDRSPLGPDLAVWKEKPKDTYIVESILHPAKQVRKGFEAVTVVDGNGKTYTGLIQSDGKNELVLKDPSRNGKLIRIPKKAIELRKSAGSIMPKGLVNQLANRQQFLDLVKYLIEVSEQGPRRAKELRPPAALFALPPVPEYEKHVDHAGLIATWDRKSFERGKAIYNVLCINCHGTKDRPGSLPTSLRFASGRFKNGNDPYAMYQTLTYGFGMMIPQAWMVPQQKYDVIHYIREVYLKPYNAGQYAAIPADYLKRLPKGNTRGPAPRPYSPWANMNYGPTLIHTYEAGRDGTNIAYKGIAVRLDGGPGGVSRGRDWMVFDHDTLRIAAAWRGKQFIDYNGIMFNGRHNIHPRITGDVHWANPTGPGWANPETGSFADPRFRGRDGKPYGPLPRDWAHYKGLYHYGNNAIISYTVGKTGVLEMPGMQPAGNAMLFTRTFNIGPRNKPMVLQVARHPSRAENRLVADGSVAMFGPQKDGQQTLPTTQKFSFNGKSYLSVARPQDFDFTTKDFTITARIRTRRGGTIFAKTATGERWVPNGKALFVRGGRLVYDIGWVGAVTSRRRVNDGKWHDVALTWDHKTGGVTLYIDGKADRTGTLKPKAAVKRHKVRIGFAAPNFPGPRSFFKGMVASVSFYSRRLSSDEVAHLGIAKQSRPKGQLGRWSFANVTGDRVADGTGGKHDATVRSGDSQSHDNGVIVAGVMGGLPGVQWETTKAGDLRLHISAGNTPLRFTLAVARADSPSAAKTIAAEIQKNGNTINLSALTKGGPPRWGQKLTTKPTIMKNGGPFEVDVLTRPAANPWSARVRFTGLDFLPDGKRMAICTWDGDVWMVSGIDDLSKGLTWQRIASGLFQPLGLKYIHGHIYLTCRDQLCILHDLNGDGETDFYQNFNNDHQVTEHFHEFAMGLQTDAEGNFYYAKSARHALPAIVPHHGTLLKVSKDGLKTEIIATGFRAANGVCVNPDGTFYVTDQEGHWTPKNRINLVHKGGFYGNMLGYHNVMSSADDAMEQPLCWITNSFDRSPAELLWVDKSAKWGPLNGSLLSLSYGYGKVFVVLRQKVGKQMQGGMCELPLPSIPTGLIRGRFHPRDGQLYVCGMFAWAGSKQQPGGAYRIRYTGKPIHVPLEMTAKKGGIQLAFSGTLDATAGKAENYAVKVWSLKRTKNYGSKHYNEHPLKVTAARLHKDGKTIDLTIPDLKPTWCIEIRYSLRNSEGEPVRGMIHGTIHKLPEVAATRTAP
jgi:putative heme-binding domain-containing protein